MTRLLNGFSSAALTAALALASPSPSLAQGADKYQEMPKPKAQPRPAPAKPAAKPSEPTQPASPPARLPLEQQPLVVEVRRKAQAQEKENGFCATTNWPIRSTRQEANAYNDRRIAGETEVAFVTFSGTPLCVFQRTLAVSVEDGRRCFNTSEWVCFVGGQCLYGANRYCRNNDGNYDVAN